MKANKLPESRNLNAIANVEQGTEGKKYISGIIPYNSRSQFMRIGYSNCSYEMLAPTVFNKTIADRADIYVNYAHNDEHILGRLSAGTLEVNNTPNGLTFKMLVPNTPWGEEAYGTIESGNCRTISFEFIPYTWKEDDTTDTVILTSAKLTAISLCVVNPAYLETDTFTSLRSMTNKLKMERRELTEENIQDIKCLVTELSQFLPKENVDETVNKEETIAEATQAEPEQQIAPIVEEQPQPDTPKPEEVIIEPVQTVVETVVEETPDPEYEAKVEKLNGLLNELDGLVKEE